MRQGKLQKPPALHRNARTAGVYNPREYKMVKTIDVFNNTQHALSFSASKRKHSKHEWNRRELAEERNHSIVKRRDIMRRIQQKQQEHRQKKLQNKTTDELFFVRITKF